MFLMLCSQSSGNCQEGHVIPPHFFRQRLRVNPVIYIEVLEAVVKPWIDSVSGERLYVFQQESVLSHKAMTTQDWMSENLHDHIALLYGHLAPRILIP